MARFRDGSPDTTVIEPEARPPVPGGATPAGPGAQAPRRGPEDGGPVHDRAIGDILAELRRLEPAQIERVLAHQRESGLRFGESAVALGLVSKDDVLFALAQQFHYPYAPDERGKAGQQRELVALNEPFSAAAEGFRALRSQLMMRVFNQPEVGGRALAVISPDSGDGKTYTAMNLAVSLAQLGGRTLLVDADMRSPRIHAVFGLKNGSGLSGILSGRADKGVIQQAAGISSLFVLPVGITPPNPLELVERPAFTLLLRELCAKFDHVIVDTPAAVHGADAAVIAARCGAAIVLARRNATRSADLRELVAQLAGAPVNLAGVVFNPV